ncbi:unnamed protein product [Mytilus edulis]|uniref:DUF6589 domain-containing protein n=1 Tax=Mytilus edulis TaxID=6550 RepID=A0A8S3UJP4_MYTED|nr:unnamed protein product [Mytilus edulis]
MFLTPQDMENKDKIEAIIPRIGMVYSMLMQGRNKELSRIQRITSLFLFDNICDQKVFDRLQTVGVCLSYERSLQIVEMIGGHFNDKVVQLVKDNTRFRIIGDNINWTVGVHDQRINNKQKMMHAFGSAVIVQNLTFTNLDRVVPQQLYSQTPVQNFIPSEEDYNLITTDYIILMSRVVFEHIPYFKKFSDIVPINISTPCSPNLKKKSEVIPLPVLFKNEQYYQDVVGILDFYEKCLKDAHDKAGKQLHDQTYQIGGDQLTRERFSGAKSLRAHHLNPSDKFTHLSPITFELFHMLMSYLKMSLNLTYKQESGQDIGTLKSLQDRLSRKNIGDNVNDHYEANKDFLFLLQTCTLWSVSWSFCTVEMIVKQHVFLQTITTGAKQQMLEVDGQVFRLVLANGKTITLMKKTISKSKKGDQISNYGNQILQLGLLFKDLIDMIHMPERVRGIRLLKLAMMYFKVYNNLSKYALEILRLLVHQLCTLSEKGSNEEFYAMFVNTGGKFETHIPADRRMEYLVKEVKQHVKHMYSNKTEENISNRTRAISGIREISVNFDQQSGVIIRKKKTFRQII